MTCIIVDIAKRLGIHLCDIPLGIFSLEYNIYLFISIFQDVFGLFRDRCNSKHVGCNSLPEKVPPTG